MLKTQRNTEAPSCEQMFSENSAKRIRHNTLLVHDLAFFFSPVKRVVSVLTLSRVEEGWSERKREKKRERKKKKRKRKRERYTSALPSLAYPGSLIFSVAVCRSDAALGIANAEL